MDLLSWYSIICKENQYKIDKLSIYNSCIIHSINNLRCSQEIESMVVFTITKFMSEDNRSRLRNEHLGKASNLTCLENGFL